MTHSHTTQVSESNRYRMSSGRVDEADVARDASLLAEIDGLMKEVNDRLFKLGAIDPDLDIACAMEIINSAVLVVKWDGSTDCLFNLRADLAEVEGVE